VALSPNAGFRMQLVRLHMSLHGSDTEASAFIAPAKSTLSTDISDRLNRFFDSVLIHGHTEGCTVDPGDTVEIDDNVDPECACYSAAFGNICTMIEDGVVAADQVATTSLQFAISAVTKSQHASSMGSASNAHVLSLLQSSLSTLWFSLWRSDLVSCSLFRMTLPMT
jgi:hypothetical protein